MNKKPQTRLQQKSYHKGFQDIANVLIENGIPLNVLIQHIEVRPTSNNIKDVFRAIAHAKYDIESTSDLNSDEVDEVWEELIKAVSETTGVFIHFPSRETTDEYLDSLEKTYETTRI
jgi:hypothetical protein